MRRSAECVEEGHDDWFRSRRGAALRINRPDYTRRAVFPICRPLLAFDTPLRINLVLPEACPFIRRTCAVWLSDREFPEISRNILSSNSLSARHVRPNLARQMHLTSLGDDEINVSAGARYPFFADPDSHPEKFPGTWKVSSASYATSDNLHRPVGRECHCSPWRLLFYVSGIEITSNSRKSTVKVSPFRRTRH